MTQPSDSGKSRAWRRETFFSVSWIVFPCCRPIVMASLANGTTVVEPSSSSIIRRRDIKNSKVRNPP